MAKLAVFENLCRTKRKLNCFQDWLVPLFFFYINLFLCLDPTHVVDQSKQGRCCWYPTQSLWARLLHMYDSCSKDLLPSDPHCPLPLEHFPQPRGPNWPRRHAPAKGWLPGNVQHRTPCLRWKHRSKGPCESGQPRLPETIPCLTFTPSLHHFPHSPTD